MKYLLSLALLLTAGSIGMAQSKTPDFHQYPAKLEKVRNIKVDLSTRNARMYRTNLRNAAKEGVNFAGHYVLTTWGCGTNCSESAIIDARNGKVTFPRELGGAIFGFCDTPDDAEPFVFKANSRLLVMNGFKSGDLDKKTGKCGIYYFDWNGTALKQVKFVQKKRTDTP